MKHNIWFVPINSSQVVRNRLLLNALGDRGCRIRLLRLDEYSHLIRSSVKQIEAAGLPFEILPKSGYKITSRGWKHLLQRRRLAKHVRRFLSRDSVDAMIFGGDNTFVSYTIVRVARSLGIATVLIPDGVVLPPNPQYRGPFAKRVRAAAVRLLWRAMAICGPRGTSGVDLILAVNGAARPAMIDYGVNPDRIKVVGSPEYDRLAETLRTEDPATRRNEVADLREKLGIPQDRPVVCFAHQPDVYGRQTTEALIRGMVSAGRECEATTLVKLHPRARTQPDEWRQWAAEEGFSGADVAFARDECTSFECVMLCEVVVTAFSTFALESLICKKPVVLVQFLNVPFRLDLGKDYDAAVDANSPDELKKGIIAALRDEDLRRRLLANGEVALQKELCGLDGQSLQRSIRHVLDLIETRD